LQDWWGGVLLLVFSTAGLLLGKGTVYGASMFPITLIILFPTVSILASRRAGAILLLLASLFLPAYVYLSGLPIATAIPLYVMIGAMYGISKFLWRRTSREMTVFLECIHQVGAASGIEEACLPALDLIHRLLSDSSPSIALFDEEKCVFQLYCKEEEYCGEGVDPDGTLPLGDNVCSKVYKTGDPIVIDDVKRHSLYVEGVPGARSELVVPIIWRGQKYGVINVESKKPGCFSNADLRSIRFFAAILGEVFSHLKVESKLERNICELERANTAFSSTKKALSCALEVTREQKENLEALLKRLRDLFDIVKAMSLCPSLDSLFPLIAQLLSQRLGYKNVYVFSRRSFGGEITLQSSVGSLPEELKDLKSLGRGVLRKVLETGESYLMTDVLKDPNYLNLDNEVRSELIVPVMSNNGLWGAIAVDDDHIGGITRQDEELLGVVTSHLALELENKESFARLSRELNRLRALLDIVQFVSGEKFDVTRVANQVVKMFSSVFCYEKITFFLVEEGDEGKPFFLKALASNFVETEALSSFSQKLYESGGGQVPKAVESQRIINTPNLKQSPFYVNLSTRITTSQLDIPISFAGKVYAVISMESNIPFDRSDEDFFLILSKHLGALLALQSIIEETKRKALVDDLTELWNRRYLTIRLAEEQSRYDRNGEPACVVMIDMRDFKQVNDRYGHFVGDRVLKAFSAFISHAVRAEDIVGRLGGDEFLIVLPGTTKNQALLLIKRLKQETVSFSVPGIECPIWADFGVASVPEDTLSFHEALRIADQRMYEEKIRRKDID